MFSLNFLKLLFNIIKLYYQTETKQKCILQRDEIKQ